jgi:hypothetical protein
MNLHCGMLASIRLVWFPIRDSLLHSFVAALGWGPSHFFAGLWCVSYLISFIQDPEHVRPWQLRGAGMTERKRVAELFRLVNCEILSRKMGDGSF